jgi:hypothetical protein
VRRFISIWPIAGFAAWDWRVKSPITPHFSRNRHGRFRQSNILRHVFEAVVRRCLAEGLVGGEGFAVDASLIEADANKQRSVPGHEWRIEGIPARATQAVKDYLATLDDAAFGAASDVTPKFVSASDPAAQWTGASSLLSSFLSFWPCLPCCRRERMCASCRARAAR